MKRGPVLVGGAVVLVLLGAGAAWMLRPGEAPTPAGPIAIDAGDAKLVALGQRVYTETCAACHGEKLEGEPNWRRRKANGRLPAPPHDASGHTWHHADDVLFQLTKFGPAALAGGGYASDMPAYDGTLGDREIAAVLAYIKSTWPEAIRARHDRINTARN